MDKLYNKSVKAKNKSDHNNHTHTLTTLFATYNIYTYTICPGKKLTSASIELIIFAYSA